MFFFMFFFAVLLTTVYPTDIAILHLDLSTHACINPIWPRCQKPAVVPSASATRVHGDNRRMSATDATSLINAKPSVSCTTWTLLPQKPC